MERKYAWHNYDDATMEKVYALSDTYRQFLDNGKTERECVVQACLLYTSPSPRDPKTSRMPSSA